MRPLGLPSSSIDQSKVRGVVNGVLVAVPVLPNLELLFRERMGEHMFQEVEPRGRLFSDVHFSVDSAAARVAA